MYREVSDVKKKSMKVLVLAPHTDDGEFACGGYINRLISEGCEVKYFAFSSCKESLDSSLPEDTLIHECYSATRTLGIAAENVHILDYPVRYFPSVRQDILEEMVSINRSYKPDLVLLPSSRDCHQDHKVIYEEGFRAFKHSTLLAYEVPWNIVEFPATYIAQLTLENIEKKIDAIRCYSSQSERIYAKPDVIKAQSISRGLLIAKGFAEAFEVLRIID